MFAGMFCLSNANATEDWLDLKALRNSMYVRHTPDISGIWSNKQAACVAAEVYNTPWSQNAASVPLEGSGSVVAFWGRLDNRNALVKELSLRQSLAQTTDAQIVQHAWTRWGEKLAGRLQGDFAIAIHDLQKQCLFLMRDPLGIKPLYYLPHSAGLFYGTSPATFTKINKQIISPDPKWVATFFARSSPSTETTAYNEVKKLQGGHWARITADGQLDIQQYHFWNDDAPYVTKRNPANIDAYREILERSVKDRMASAFPLGCESSGGLDSSTVMSYLAKFLAEDRGRLHAYGFAFFEREPEFILSASRACDIHFNHIFSSFTFEASDSETILGDLDVLGYPEEHLNSTSHRPFYENCRTQNIRTLYSGFGGDETVTNAGHRIADEFLNERNYWLFLRTMKGNWPAKFAKAARFIYRRPNSGKSSEPAQRNAARFIANMPLKRDAISKYQIRQLLEQKFHNPTLHERQNDLIINHHLRDAMWHARTENCTLMAASYGVEYRWPLLDPDLIQRYLSTPIIDRQGPNGQTRYLHRRAVSEVVSDKVAWKDGKFMGPKIPGHYDQENIHRPLLDTLRRNINDLHPMLDDILDHRVLEKYTSVLNSSSAQSAQLHTIKRNTAFINKLNHWLHGRAVG